MAQNSQMQPTNPNTVAQTDEERLLEIDNIGVVDDSNKIKQFFAYIISQDDIMDAMTGAMKNAGGLI